jgi:hypothetical protein
MTGDKSADTFPPRCVCGSEMKKVYSPPSLQKLAKTEALQRLHGIEGHLQAGSRRKQANLIQSDILFFGDSDE